MECTASQPILASDFKTKENFKAGQEAELPSVDQGSSNEGREEQSAVHLEDRSLESGLKLGNRAMWDSQATTKITTNMLTKEKNL